VKLVALLGLWLWGASAPGLPQEMAPEKILEPPTVPATPVAPGSVHLETSSPPPAPLPGEASAPFDAPPASAAPLAPLAPPAPSAPLAPPAPFAAPPAAPAPTIPIQAAAPPEEAPRFGATGQVVLGAAMGASLGHLGVDTGDSLVTGVIVEPSIQYIQTPNDSDGLELFFRYDQTTDAAQIREQSVSYGAAAALGVNRWLGQRVSIWPRLGLGVAQTRATLSTTSGVVQTIGGVIVTSGQPASVIQNAIVFRLYAPFLLHVGAHAFVGIGPDVYLDVIHTGPKIADRSFVGLSATAGGWR